MKGKILFFGLGSIGIKHVNILKKEFDISAYRTKKGQEISKIPVEEFDDIKEAFCCKPNIAFITNPTNKHVQTALECAKRNIHLFIEKPISHNLELVDELEKEINKRNLVSYVAYNLRFHPVIEEIKKMIDGKTPLEFNVTCKSYLPNWRPNQDYSQSYSAKKEMGGGVTLDLSHEFDYITWLFGEIKEMKGYCDKISNLDINSEDVLEAEIKCNDGIKGKIHLDYFTKDIVRKIEIKFSDKIIEACLVNNTVKTIVGENIKIKKFECKKDETYKKQIQYFLNQYDDKNTHMMNNYSDALKTFKKIIEFKEKNCKI